MSVAGTSVVVGAVIISSIKSGSGITVSMVVVSLFSSALATKVPNLKTFLILPARLEIKFLMERQKLIGSSAEASSLEVASLFSSFCGILLVG